jgi:chromosome segregation ATPase
MPTQKEMVDQHQAMLINHHERLATVVERMDGCRGDVSRIERQLKEVGDLARSLDIKLNSTAEAVERLEKRLDEVRSRRHEIIKLVIAAAVAAFFSLVTTLGLRYLERDSVKNTTPAAVPRAR